jgi:hypothetical protein
MPKWEVFAICLSVFMLVAGCAGPPDRYNTQRGAAVGAGLGAVMGQAIGRDTESTLIGAGVGGLLGSVIGNAEDQKAAEIRDQQRVAAQSPPPLPPPVVSPSHARVPPGPGAPPPGRWVEVPGQWVNGRWIPPHHEWEPVNP